MTTPSTHALTARAEYDRREAIAREGMAARKISRAQADRQLRLWAALVRFVDGDLPERLRDEAGNQPHWIDFFDATTPASAASTEIAQELRAGIADELGITHANRSLLEIAQELRRATTTLLARQQTDPTLTDRTRALLRLDDHVSIRAGLPAIGAQIEAERAAA